MKQHNPLPPHPHPGPEHFVTAGADAEGIIIAVGFTIMGFVAFPFAKWFLLGAMGAGLVFALCLRLANRS